MHEFELKIEKFINKHSMLSAERVILGVSGGADSTALLLVMLALREKYNLSITVVHVNHGLRPEAASEAETVKKLCIDNNVKFVLKEYDVESLAKANKKSCEEMGRELRYEAFREEAGDDGLIFVAHNKNDLSETMLFNLFRGTGITGLASIAPVRGNIRRPLLNVSRTEIEKYLSDINTSYCTDKSNFTDDYTRNRIRNNIIPVIERDVSDHAVDHMANTATQLRELNEYVLSQGNIAMNRCINEKTSEMITFNRKRFDSEDIYIRRLMIKLTIDCLVPNNKDITSSHIESVLALPVNLGYKEVNLPYGLIGFVAYDEIGLKKKPESGHKIGEYIVNGETDIIIDGIGKFETSYVPNDMFTSTQEIYTKFINCDKITHQLLIRTRREGDYIVVNSRGGRKKLKDYFIDAKIPLDERDKILLLADGDRILWVTGYRISEDSKVYDDTGKILKITYIPFL